MALIPLLIVAALPGNFVAAQNQQPAPQPSPTPSPRPSPTPRPSPSPTPQAPPLPLFGTELLEQEPLVVRGRAAEALQAAITARDYRLGPGDRLAVNIWRPGKVPNQFDLVIPPEGTVFFPVIGEVKVGGLTLEQAKRDLERRVTARLPGFRSSLLLTGLRTVRVLVVGEVRAPGYYPANPLSTAAEVLSLARLNEIGSMRAIQLRDRSGAVRSIDLYRFLTRGSVADNPTVREGTVIVVPRRYGVVEVGGAVGRPARYEIIKGDRLKDVLILAGGPAADAYRAQFHLVRVAGQASGAPQRFMRLSLDGLLAGDRRQNLEVRDRDVVRILSLTEFAKGNVVLAAGAVRSPGEFPLAEGMRVRDLLLLAGGPGADAYTPRAELSRIRPPDGGQEHREIILVNVTEVMRNPASSANVLLRPGDILTIYPLSFVRGGKVQIAGAVRQPGEYELVSNMRVGDLVFQAGGVLPDADMERVQLERVVSGQKVVLPVNLARFLLENDETQNLRLQFGDVLTIPSMLELARIVFVEGRVRQPGGYTWRQNETVSTLIARAGGPILEGGLPPQGFVNPSLQLVGPADLQGAYVERTEKGGARRRVAVDLHRLLVERDGSVDIALQPGDILVVPSKIQQVFVLGFVVRPGGYLYEPNRSVRHYVSLAAPRPDANVGKTAVRRLDGTLTGGLDTIVHPGDTILVPQQDVNALLQLLGLIVPLLRLIIRR